MKRGLSKYKIERIAVEALKNSLRLHFDSILLFKNASHPTAFQVSVLALEEFAKAKWVESYYFYSIASGFPDEKFEQQWLQLHYLHPEKQAALFARNEFEYSPSFVDFIRRKKLELKKQRSVYVGLDRVKGKVNIASRISTPSRIKKRDAKQMISLLNSEFLELHRLLSLQGDYFFIGDMDKVIRSRAFLSLKKWRYKTGLKSQRWFKQWFNGKERGERKRASGIFVE